MGIEWDGGMIPGVILASRLKKENCTIGRKGSGYGKGSIVLFPTI